MDAMELLEILKFVDDTFSFVEQAFLPSIFSIAIAVAALMNKDDNNTLLLIGVILALKLFGSLYVNDFLLSNENISNIMFYFCHSLIDVIYIAIVFFRVKVFLLIMKVVSYFIRIFSDLFLIRINKSISVELDYRRHIDEYQIILLFVFSILVNVFMMIEYGIRLLGHKQVLYVYYLYTPVKVILSIYGVVLLFKIGYQAKKVFVKE